MTQFSLRPVVTVVALVLLTLLIVPPAEAVWNCVIGQWCYDQGEYEFKIMVSGSATVASSTALCAADNAQLVTFSTNAVDALRSAGGAAPEVWTSLQLAPANTSGIGIIDSTTGDSFSGFTWSALQGGDVSAGNCFSLSQSLGRLVSRPCNSSTHTMSAVMCARTGRPTSWFRTNRSEFEYAFFTLRVSRQRAQAICNESGATLAFLKLGDTDFTSELAAALNISSTTTYWTAFNGLRWESMSVPLRLPANVESFTCPLIVNFGGASPCTPSPVNDPHSFLCSRLPRPDGESTNENGTENVGVQVGEYLYDGNVDHYLRYSPRRDLSNLTRSHMGVTPAENVADCATDGGEAFKFQNHTLLVSTLGVNLTRYLMTIYTTRSNQQRWLDDSFAPFPPRFNIIAIPEVCFYYHNTTSSVIVDARPDMRICAERLPGVCQYNMSTNVTFSIAVPAAEVASLCTATWTATASRPPFGGQVFRLCQTGAAASMVVPCFNFSEGQTKATIAVRNPSGVSAFSVTWRPQCDPEELCSPQAIVTSVVNKVNTMLQIGGVNQNVFQPIFNRTGFGIEITLPTFRYTTFVSGYRARLQLYLQGDSGLDCVLYPSSSFLITSLAFLPTVRLICDTGTDVPRNVTVRANSTDLEEGKCSLTPLRSALVGTYELSQILHVSCSNISAPAFSATPLRVTLSVSTVPSNVSWPRWLCLRPVAYGLPDIAATRACFYSATPHITEVTSTITVLNYSALASTWIRYAVEGNGAAAYSENALVAHWFLEPVNVTVTGINDEEYVSVPVTIRISIPFAPPTAANLTVGLSFVPDPGNSSCGLDAVNITFRAGGDVAVEQVWNPTCRTNATLVIRLFNTLAYLYGIDVDRTRISVIDAQAIVLSPIPRSFFIKAPEFVVVASLPSPVKSFNTTLCPVIEGFLSNPPLRISPPCHFWDATTTEPKRFSFIADSFAYQAVLNWTLTGTARMYSPPAARNFDVWNQTHVHFDIEPQQAYFLNTWYNLRATFEVLPFADESLVIQAATTATNVIITPTSVTASSNRTVSIPVMIHAADAGTNWATVPLNFTGVARNNFWVTSMNVRVDRVLPQAVVTVTPPTFLLIGEGSDGERIKTIAFNIDQPPRGSAKIVVSVFPTDTLLVNPSEVTWRIGERQERLITVVGLSVASNASINFTVASFDNSGAPTGEVRTALSPASHANIPVRTKTVVLTSFPSGSAATLTLGRSASGSVDINTLPSSGDITITPTGGAEFVAFSPPFITFTPSSNTTVVEFLTIPTRVTTTAISIVYELSGTALGQYTLLTARRSFTLSIADRIALVPVLPDALITGLAEPYVATINLPQLPVGDEVLQATFACDGCAAALDIQPPTWEWSSTSNSTSVAVRLVPRQAVQATIVATVGGNASGFAGFVRIVAIRNPSPVIVTFPTARLYAGETAQIKVDISNPVLSRNKYIDFIARASLSCCLQVPSLSLTFQPTTPIANRTVQRFFIESFGNITRNESMFITILASGTALDEFNLTSTVTQGTVTFMPKRWVRIVDMPDIFYDGETTAITVAIQENPDPDNTVIVTTLDETSSALWEGTASNTFATPALRVLTVALLLRNPTIQLVLRSPDSAQAARYQVAPLYRVVVESKIAVSFGNTIFPTQVLGALNNQSLTVTINRLPLLTLTLTPTFRSPFARTLSFTPPTLVWPARNMSNATSLTQTIFITGELIGSARDLRFMIDGHLKELSATETSVVASLLSIVPSYTVQFTGTFDRLYIGPENRQRLTITISNVPRVTLVLNCSFTDDGAVEFVPPQVVFRASPSTPLVATVDVIARRSGTTGNVLMDVISGPEFSPVVLGNVGFVTFPRIRAWIVVNGAEVVNGSRVLIESDRITKGEFYINEFPSRGQVATFFLRYAASSSLIIENLTFPFEVVTNQSRLMQPLDFLASSLTERATVVEIVAPTQPIFVPGIVFTVVVAAAVNVNVTAFPQFVTSGEVNRRSFNIVPSRLPVFGSLLEVAISDVVCAPDGATDLARSTANLLPTNGVWITPSRALTWSTADARNPVIVTVQTNASLPMTCQVQLNQRASPVSGRFPLHRFATLNFAVRPSPRISMANYTTGASTEVKTLLGATEVIPFRVVRNDGITFTIDVRNGPLANFGGNETLNYTMAANTPEAIAEVVAAGYHMAVLVSRSVAEDPRGFLVNRGDPKLYSLRTEAGGTVIKMTLGPFPSLVLLEEQDVRLRVFNGAFADHSHPVGDDGTVSVKISEYVPSVVATVDIATIVAQTGLASVGFGAAPGALLQPGKQLTLLFALDCPSSLLSDKPDASGALEVAAGLLGFTAFVAGVHGLIVLGFYIQRRADSSRRVVDLCGRFHMPSIEFIIIYVVIVFFTNAITRVLVHSDSIVYRIIAFCIAIPFVVAVPVAIHGVVWRGTSLWYDSVFMTNKMRREMCVTRIMRKSGKWQHPDPSYIRRYWFLFNEQRANFRWYMLYEYFIAIAFGAAGGVSPETRQGCTAKCAAITTIFGIQFVSVVLWRPFRTAYWNIVMSIVYAVQLCAAVLVTQQVGLEIRNDDTQRSAIALMILTSTLMVAALIINAVYRFIRRAKGTINDKLASAMTAGRPRGNGAASDKAVALLGDGENNADGAAADGAEASDRRRLTVPTTAAGFGGGAGGLEGSDDDEDAPEVRAALADLELAERHMTEPAPIGVFRSGHKVVASFSPLRRQQLEAERLHRQREAESLQRRLAAGEIEMTAVEVGSGAAGAQESSAERKQRQIDDMPWLHAAATGVATRAALEAAEAEQRAASLPRRRLNDMPLASDL